MIHKFKKGEQKRLIIKALTKAGSERKLSKVTGIPKGSIYFLKFEKRNISDSYLNKVCNYLKIDIKKIKTKKLPSNWGQIKGGKNLIRKKISDGKLNETLDRLRESSSRRMKQWHKHMKKNEPETYYKWQYERFKKIGKGYSFLLINGTKVRNSLEKTVGDFLIKKFLDIKYEPYININGKAYFPDFIYKNIIVEVTEWKHPSKEKIGKLNKKIKDYKSKNYVCCFFIPSRYRKFYKGIKSHVISTLPNLQEFINASVA